MTGRTVRELSRELPVRGEYDVLVAGGGTAGVVAAIASARNGARTVLVEQLPLPGGTMANGGIVANSFFSTYTPESPVPKRIVKGIPEEIEDRLIRVGGCPGAIKVDERKNSYHRPYLFINDPEIYSAVIGEMLLESGVKVYLHTFLSDVLKDKNGQPYGVIVESKSSREAILAKCFVDCTGDADLAVHAGADPVIFYQEYNVKHLASVGKIFGIGNVNFERFMEFAKQDGIVEEAVRGPKLGENNGYVRISLNFTKGKLSSTLAQKVNCRGMTFFSIHPNTIDFVNGIGKQDVNILDLDDFSEIELEMQSRICELTDFLKENFPGFEASFLKSTANQIGIRASRVVETDYFPTIEEITNSARFADEIGMYGHSDYAPVDEKSVMRNQGMYGLPYRMLLPKGVDNVLVAGRMVSCVLRSHMSTRNTVSCMIQGQAAGTAAALCAASGILPRDLPYSMLRSALERGNVYFEPKNAD